MMAIPTIGIISSFALNSIFNNKLSKFIVLIGAIYIPMSIMHGHGLFKRSDIDQVNQLKKLEYVLSITKQDDRVYDGNIKFNIFRDNIDYFWLCAPKNNCVGPYKTISDHDYDVFESILLHRPKVISTFGIDNLDDARIKSYYKVSDRYEDLLIRAD
jgi:hypothetical protein